MLEKMLAKLGHGGAKVDLQLSKPQYLLGETIAGEITITGGKVSQKINQVVVELYVSISRKERVFTHLLTSFPFSFHTDLNPGERRSFPFQFPLPHEMLLSASSIQYFFLTKLDIAGAIDASDRDYFQVLPPVRLQKVIGALEHLGFHEKHTSRKFDGYVQEFAFAPTSFLRGKVEEVEFVAVIEEEGISLHLELDVYGFLGEEEARSHIRLANHLLEDQQELARHLQAILTEMLKSTSTSSFFHQSTSFHHTHPSFHYRKHHKRHHGMSGIGSFAAGFFAAELLDEVVDEFFDEDDNDNSGFADFAGDGDWGDDF